MQLSTVAANIIHRNFIAQIFFLLFAFIFDRTMWESTPRNSVFCSTMLNNAKKTVSFETREGFQFLVFLSFWIQAREIEACKMCHFFLFSFWMQFSRHFLFIVPYLRFKWHEWTSQPTRCNERYGTKFEGYAVSLQINIYFSCLQYIHTQRFTRTQTKATK